MKIIFSQSKGLITKDGKNAILSGQAMRALEFFMNNEGKVISKEKFVDACWTSRGAVVSDNAVRQTLYRLRRAFEDIGAPEDVLTTQVRNGYLLRAGIVVMEKDGDAFEENNCNSTESIHHGLLVHTDAKLISGSGRFSQKFKNFFICLCVIILCSTIGFISRKSIFIHEIHYTKMLSHEGLTFYYLDGYDSMKFNNDKKRAMSWLRKENLLTSSVKNVYINPVWNENLSMFLCDNLIEKKESRCSSLIIIGNISK